MTDDAVTRFATWFHQDILVMFADFDKASGAYIATLSRTEARELEAKLRLFMIEHPGKGGRGLRNAFLRLGAQAAPRPRDMRVWLEGVLTTVSAV